MRAALKRAPDRARRLMGRVMRLTFSDGWVGDDLGEYLRRSNFVVEHIGPRKLEIHPRQTLSPELARLEIEGLLRVWCKLHPEASISASASTGGNVELRLRHDYGAEERATADARKASSDTHATRTHSRRE
jgi:hypothetical protein